MDAVRTIKYIRYFIEYLDDGLIKDLISFIFGKSKFFIKPFNTNKDFLLYLINAENVKIDYKCKITYEELVYAKEEITSLQEEDLLDKEDIIRDENIYYQLKCAYENIDDLSEEYLGYDDIGKLLEFYNDLFIPVDNSAKTILNVIDCIAESIESIIDIEKINKKNKKYYVKFLNYVIHKIIKNKFCYIIYEYKRSEEFEVIKKVFELDWDKNLKINSENFKIKKQDFIKNFETLYRNSSTNINRYRKLNTAITKAITQKINYCHICYSSLTNNKKQKCDNCKKIYKLIKEIDETRNTNNITSRIKGKKIYEKDLTIERKRQRRHTNLIRFVKDLEDKIEQENKKDLTKLNTINTKTTEFPTEKIKQLYHLIEYGFGEKNNKI